MCSSRLIPQVYEIYAIPLEAKSRICFLISDFETYEDITVLRFQFASCESVRTLGVLTYTVGSAGQIQTSDGRCEGNQTGCSSCLALPPLPVAQPEGEKGNFCRALAL